MQSIIYDVETSTSNKGSPYDRTNKAVLWGYLGDSGCTLSDTPIPWEPDTRLVGCNLKFDLTWARRHGILLPSSIHDVQLGHFLLTGQSQPYPSLESIANHYGLAGKLDVVKLEYWDKGVDTPDIPKPILCEYLQRDLEVTKAVYERQLEDFKKNPQLYKLFQLQCEDLFTLMEMEWNGLVVDIDKCNTQAIECETKLESLDLELREFIGDVPINFNSNDHLSALLYGGTIVHETRVPIGTFKSGAKIGQVRYKKIEYNFPMKGYFPPLKGSELAKEGYYSTDEDTLRSLRGSKRARQLVDSLLERSKLEKLKGTYYRGVPKKLESSNSIDGRLHGQFNQCVARTGRLSSSAPNLQNFPPEMNRLMVSRYDDDGVQPEDCTCIGFHTSC